MANNAFYVTTAIYYPTAAPHVGSAFEIIGADAVARYQRLRGRDVRFLTGMDEHAERVLDTARARDETPQQYVDEVAGIFRETWGLLHISNDDFIRTTEARHKQVVSAIFKRLLDQGDIYPGEYRGLYCSKCETFLTDSQVARGRCPGCGREPRSVSEPANFFRLSKYQQPLERHMAEHPGFILPAFRQNEMINSFLTPGLVDMCISRKTIDWGVPLPDETEGVIYVWFDALINYLTGCGYLQDDDQFNRYWPADVHVIGKDIPRFHTILWPAMLMALDLPLPGRIFIHGFIGMDGTKMSKSTGNVVDPKELSARFGADSLRYFLLREVSFSGDGAFSVQRLAERYNFDLANDLGNLLSRTVTMIERYLDGLVPQPQQTTETEAELRAVGEGLLERIDPLMDQLQFHRALEAIWELVRAANRYAERTEPWKLAKDPSARGRLDAVLYSLAEELRIISVWISPFMPHTAMEVRQQLGLGEAPGALPDSGRWGLLPVGTKVVKGQLLFPKVDLSR